MSAKRSGNLLCRRRALADSREPLTLHIEPHPGVPEAGSSDGQCAWDPEETATSEGSDGAEEQHFLDAAGKGGNDGGAGSHVAGDTLVRGSGAGPAHADTCAADAAGAADSSAAGEPIAEACEGRGGGEADAAGGAADEADVRQQQAQAQRRPMRLELLIPPAAHGWVGARILGGDGGRASFLELAAQVGIGLCLASRLQQE